jgi:hypothetical protein
VDRHPLADLADDLERGGPAAEDHGGPQDDHRRGGVAQDPLDLAARPDVVGELVVLDIRHHSREVDDAVDAVGTDPVGEVAGGLAVSALEVVPTHPMDQVVDGRHALAGSGDLVGVEGVHDDGLDPLAPPRLVAVGVGGGRPHLVATLEQQWHQPAPDVPGRTCHQDLHVFWLSIGCRRLLRRTTQA